MKIFLCILGSLCASIAAAQQPTPSPTKPATQHSCCNHRLVKRPARATITITSSPATPAAPDFFIGEAKVDVTKDETVVRLAMAQHGSVLIELPANDGPRYIIPGDPEMATVDEKALEKNKRAIVVRPGALFLAPPLNRRAHSPAATVTVQMRSGLVVTFLFYPVEDLAQNVHRCVLSYNRDEVVARRRAAGLPVNLDISNNSPERRDDTAQSAAPISISVEDGDGQPPTKETEKSSSTSAQSETELKPKAENEKGGLPPAVATSESPGNRIETPAGVIQTAREALAEAIKKPSRFKKWTRPVHGLTLSVLQQREPKNDVQVLLVAVKNTTSDDLKLTSGGPDLIVEMLDGAGKPLNIQSIRKLHTEASEASGAISPKGTLYYAIAYSAPVLGVNQQIKVLVSQTSAADEPASVALVSGGR